MTPAASAAQLDAAVFARLSTSAGSVGSVGSTGPVMLDRSGRSDRPVQCYWIGWIGGIHRASNAGSVGSARSVLLLDRSDRRDRRDWAGVGRRSRDRPAALPVSCSAGRSRRCAAAGRSERGAGRRRSPTESAASWVAPVSRSGASADRSDTVLTFVRRPQLTDIHYYYYYYYLSEISYLRGAN